MKKEYDFSEGERGKFHNHDGEFIVPKRDILPLYEFQLRMAIAKRENLPVKCGCNVSGVDSSVV